MDKWRWIGKRRRWVWALAVVFVIGIVAVAALVWGGDDEGATAAAPEASTTTSRSTSTTPSSTTPTTTPTVSSSTTTTAQRNAIPGVAVVTARTGGGSGEVVLDWDAVIGATGYRVLRSAAAGDRFETVADFDVTTGTTTAADEVVNIWSEQHSYVPSRGTPDGPDQSPWFQYVDIGAGQRCYRVIAYNPAGDGPASAVACGSPP